MRTRRKKSEARAKFESESHLCDGFIEFARSKGFKVYVETADFDLLLVATEDSARAGYTSFLPGDQLGVQAKLRPNLDVLAQALPRVKRGGRDLGRKGPQYYAVLVPSAEPSFYAIAAQLGITVFAAHEHDGLPRSDNLLVPTGIRYHRHSHAEPCWVPEVEVAFPAGVAAPKQLTPWKMAAVKLCVLGISKGYLTTVDFKTAKVDMSRWFQKKWIVAGGWVKEDGKRLKSYALNEDALPPHRLYPEVVEALDRAGVI